MKQAIFFSEKAIAETEKQMRRQIIAGATGTPDDAAFIRFARDLCPLFVRKSMEEINIGGEASRSGFTAKVKVIAWMMAQLVAAMPGDSDRAGAVKRLADLIGDHAAAMVSEATEENLSPPGQIIRGEA